MRKNVLIFNLILSGFCLTPLLLQAQQTNPRTTEQTKGQTNSELSLWQSTERSDTQSAYSEYLRQFPNGAFSALAKTRVAPKLLSDMLPIAPEADNPIVQTEIAAARQAWDETAWNRVKAANTHAAYREYLLHLPTGIHAQEALGAYRASLPTAPSGRLAECVTENTEGKATKLFDTRNAYPDYAIERWTDGIVIGTNHVDYTGAPLGFELAYASNPAMFGPGAQKYATKMIYTPSIQNCAQVADTATVVISYLMGDLPFESRQNAQTPPLQAALGTRLVGTLPADRAILVQFKPSPGLSVYEIDFQSRFPPLLTQIVEGRARPLPLVSNKLFVTSSDEPITLRVSSRDKPNSRRQNMGPFRLEVRQIFNQLDRPKPSLVSATRGTTTEATR
jgi:hypothetical protein